MLKFLKKLFGWGVKTISKSEAKNFKVYIKKSQRLDAKHQIIELDKIYHNILRALGYEGSFGDILKQHPKEIRNIQTIWDLHKLRNSLVHELRDFDERLLMKKSQEYRDICERFLSQITG